MDRLVAKLASRALMFTTLQETDRFSPGYFEEPLWTWLEEDWSPLWVNMRRLHASANVGFRL